MSRFPSAAHLCSWAGIAPGNHESAGKRKSGKTRKGNKKLKSALTEAARAVARTKDTYLSSQYHRIAARRGKNRGAVAVAHSILTSANHMMQRREPYRELGPTYFDERKKEVVTRQAIKRLEDLGYEQEAIEKKRQDERIKLEKSLLDILSPEIISEKTGLNIDEVKKLKE